MSSVTDGADAVASGRSKWATYPIALTPESVRPAPVTLTGERKSAESACSRHSWTVAAPDWICHPQNPDPS